MKKKGPTPKRKDARARRHGEPSDEFIEALEARELANADTNEAARKRQWQADRTRPPEHIDIEAMRENGVTPRTRTERRLAKKTEA